MIKNVIAAAILCATLMAAEGDRSEDTFIVSMETNSPPTLVRDLHRSVTVFGATNILWNFEGTNKVGLTISTNLSTNWQAFATNTLTRKIKFVGAIRTNRVMTLDYAGKKTPAIMDVLGEENVPSQVQEVKATPVKR